MDKRTLKLKEELDALQKEESNYQFIKDFRCQTEEEFENFKKENIDSFSRLKKIKTRIRKIQWELMTDEEKKEHLQYLKKLKNKFN